MKILSIGNSFSDDAHAYLHALAKDRAIDLTTVNLVIGGCSLETHWDNAKNNNANYALCINGNDWRENRVTIEEILKGEEFDAVTLQQVSHFSGQSETYQPYLDELASYVRKHQPSAKLYFQRTWAYEIDSTHEGFLFYDRDQKKMYDSLVAASKIASEAISAEIIPSGDVIQKMRDTLPEFDYQNGGESLCRDGFHLSLTYGRYAAALTWLSALTGTRAEPMPFMELDTCIIAKICEIVNEIVFGK